MAFQPGPNLAEFSLLALQAEVPVQNTFGVYRATGWTGSELDATCTRLAEWAESSYRNVLPFDTFLQRIDAVDFTTQNSPTGQHVWGTPPAGQLLSKGTANNVSYHISRKGNVRGKAARGGVYVFGIAEGAVDNNRISAEYATNLLAAFQELTAVGFWGVGNIHVTISKRIGDNPRPSMIYFPITKYYTSGLLIADMGRRLK